MKEDFEIAFATVEAKKDLGQKREDLINGRLLVLEKELGKERGKIDTGKIERSRASFEKYRWLSDCS